MIKPYPIGKQSFEATITGGFKYIDKTERIFQMIQHRTMVFLSRPRRFGKTFLLDTLHCYFEGKKDLFKGLAIERLEHDWIKYPVIRLDMCSVMYNSLEQLPLSIASKLSDYEDKYGIEHWDGLPISLRFNHLVRSVFEVTGKKVVVLVDSYDSPFIDHIFEADFEKYKQIVMDLYFQVKALESFIHFVFITGVTNYSIDTVLPSLDNVINLSYDGEFADICGFSEDELLYCFKEDIDSWANENVCSQNDIVKKIEYYYRGYCFNENSKLVYNPIDILSAFANKNFKSYWIETADLTILTELMNRYDVDVLNLDNKETFETVFRTPHDNFSSIYPLLYQSGYLTIKSYNDEFRTYVLGYPNTEVRVSMMEAMIPSWVGSDFVDSTNYMLHFYFAIKRGNIDEGFGILKDFFYQIPNMLNNKNEKHYQTVIYVLFTWLGFYNKVEVFTAKGRIDCVLFTDKNIFIIEFKVDESAQTALCQINQMNYASKYQSDGREIIKVGVNLSSAERTIGEWVIER